MSDAVSPFQLTVGVANAVPKLVVYRLLKPAIERPEPPKAVGEPIVWVVVDEVTYGKRPLWPLEPDGGA